jgi:hypothetical protein
VVFLFCFRPSRLCVRCIFSLRSSAIIFFADRFTASQYVIDNSRIIASAAHSQEAELVLLCGVAAGVPVEYLPKTARWLSMASQFLTA